jgi:hypothetical protein
MLKNIFFAGCLLVISMASQAGFISGTKTFADGKIVNLQGLEWMPLTYTAGLSRNQVEAADGFTDTNGTLWSAGVWRYATQAETGKLLGSLWGGTHDGFWHNNYAGAAWFVAMFGGLVHSQGWGGNSGSYSKFYNGVDNDCHPSDHMSCLGAVNSVELTGHNMAYHAYNIETRVWENGTWAGYRGIGEFRCARGNTAANHDNVVNPFTFRNMCELDVVDNGVSDVSIGSLLVRTVDAPVAAVSSPTAFSLFALGLCGLLLRRRKIAA